jgi:hypothetical protein
VAKEKVEVAKELAKKHYEVEAGLVHVFRIVGKMEESPSEPIKLLEVNENTVPTGVMPLGFDPAPAGGIPFPSIIIELTPDEFKKLEVQELTLPNGWQLGEELPKSAPASGAA